jgi:hypothetical protein
LQTPVLQLQALRNKHFFQGVSIMTTKVQAFSSVHVNRVAGADTLASAADSILAGVSDAEKNARDMLSLCADMNKLCDELNSLYSLMNSRISEPCA